MGELDSLLAVSPVDGRYRRRTEKLANFFSEKALMGYRVLVESEYLVELALHPQIDLNISDAETSLLRGLHQLSLEDAKIIKAIEVRGYEDIPATNHDVKAVEYFMKLKLRETSLKDRLEWIHLALTSEDPNNLAYALMLSDGIEEVMLPTMEELQGKIEEFAYHHKDAMLARTHGQPASPTTVGKEFKVFASRLERQIDQLKNYEILAKLNGATGNYNAHVAAYPSIDWIEFTRGFINNLNWKRTSKKRIIQLKPNLITTQIEPHDTYAELFGIVSRFNNIVIDFCQDMWRYISDNWIKQKPVEGEVGSSTMPHKVNPIDFENCEGNLGIANSLFEFFSRKLPISRLQRDLSDSTVERNFGMALAYCLIGYTSALKGMGKIAVNEEKVVSELESHPEVISEAVQVILKREGVAGAYEKLKDFTRGKKITLEGLREFIDTLEISDEVKKELKKLSPTNYIGIAQLLIDI